MSYPHSSMNESGESGTSSLQRAGLNISVGDTKSIVLALQALQAKIRSLEQDRDYHQDQYERALQEHEAYKLAAEQEAERERAAHRRREQELSDMLERAQRGQAELEEAARARNSEEDGAAAHNADLAALKNELEAMLREERELAQRREERLTQELERLRADVARERSQHAALLMSIDTLTNERNATEQMNQQLRLAVDELLAREEEQQQQGLPQPHNNDYENSRRVPAQGRQSRRSGTAAGSRGAVPSRPSTRGPHCSASSSSSPQGRRHPGVSSSQGAPVRQRQPSNEQAMTGFHPPQRRPPTRHYPYQDPTCNSILRDIRNVSGEIPCSHPDLADISMSETASRPRPTSLGPPQQRDAQTATRPAVRSPARDAARPARRALYTGEPHADHHRASADMPTDVPANMAPGVNDSVADVESQLREELADLEAQYRDAVGKASSGVLPRDALTAALQRISDLIDDKVSQLNLISKIRQGSLNVSGGGGGGDSFGTAGSPPVTATQHAENKAVQRQQLMNALRSY